MNCGARTPTKYPAKFSYKMVIDKIKSKDVAVPSVPKKYQPSSASESDDSSLHSGASVISARNTPGALIVPSVTCLPGDRKTTHKLKDGGVLHIINRPIENTVFYMLKCSNGRRVYLEKSDETASLALMDQNGNVTKSIGCDL